MQFHIWTIGCQMNKADSERVAAALEGLGLQATARPDEADVVILNSCVVRGNAEERVMGKLGALRGLKRKRPQVLLGLMGCLVPPERSELAMRFPYVDVFFTVHEIPRLLQVVKQHAELQELAELTELRRVPSIPVVSSDAEFSLENPTESSSPSLSPTKYVPIIYGCNNFCTYCIVPYRRGREQSRPPQEIVGEVEQWVDRGAKEVTLLGQNVDAYRGSSRFQVPGFTLLGQSAICDLADLLTQVHDIPGLLRLRFLTSHPRDMSDKLIATVASLPKLCQAINLPVQSGDDDILTAMRRGYTVDEYRSLIARLRAGIPGVTLTTDLIVGFPGETEEQFQRSYDLLAELRFDLVHVAAYSPRPGTRAEKLPDDVPPEEKARRLQAVETLQTRIATEINASLLGQTVEILVEGQHKGKWMGRTRSDKIVFFQAEGDWVGKLVSVRIVKTGPWSLQGDMVTLPWI